LHLIIVVEIFPRIHGTTSSIWPIHNFTINGKTIVSEFPLDVCLLR
jgi:hypothetical protein